MEPTTSLAHASLSFHRMIGLLAMATLMVGCGKASGNTNIVSFRNNSSVTGNISMWQDEVTLRAPGAPEALINAAGDLQIDRHPMTLDPAQRALLQDYYRNVLAMNGHDMATDMAGAAAGVQAAKSVVQQVASGDTGNIDQKMQVKPLQVTEQALKICQDLARIKVAQDSLAGQLAAFKPYAGMIEASAITDCEAATTRRG